MSDVLKKHLSNVIPSAEYNTISRFPWKRIYTLNIDDAIFTAMINSKQSVNRHSYYDNINDADPFYTSIDVITLNGYVHNIKDGIIFSQEDYAEGLINGSPWYERCASDFMSNTFVFIGTSLNESLLDYHIQRLKKFGQSQGRHYLVAPGLTDIKKINLSQCNITPIDASFKDFSDWLEKTFPDGLDIEKLVYSNYPQFLNLSIATARLYENIILVNREMKSLLPEDDKGEQKRFYRGFKPTWNDIVFGIPAELRFIEELEQKIFSTKKFVIPVIGQAGCGKTTLLMQAAYKLSMNPENIIYSAGQLPNFFETITDINKHHKSGLTCVFLDDTDFQVDELYKYLKTAADNKIIFICATRSSVWEKRVQGKIGDNCDTKLEMSVINDDDARRILDKLKKYGNMTVLGKISLQDQIKSLTNISDRQLLIGLIEATYGRGFYDIIENEYSSLSEDERLVLLTIAVINDRRLTAPEELIHLAFMTYGKAITNSFITTTLSGIVTRDERGNYVARHPVYVSKLLEMVDPREAKKAVIGVLDAICQYGTPVYNHAKRPVYNIYKALINHDFLFRLLKGKEELILDVYKSYEKRLELDGLFWLQYGLMYRQLSHNEMALEILRSAHTVYAMPHTIHALGHQFLICAIEASDDAIIDSYIESAIGYLRNLDSFIDSDDTYPIVTLATNHVSILKKRGQVSEAKKQASYYHGIVQGKLKQKPHDYQLNKCAEYLMREYVGIS